MKINNYFLSGIIAFTLYSKYQRFINFIDDLRLDLRIVKIENGYATVNLINQNTLHIPYNFIKVDLIINKIVWAATNTQKNANLLIVPNSNIPISFKMLLDNVEIEELEKAEIAIKYNFFGLSFERLYKPGKKSFLGNESDSTVLNNTRKCGCKQKK